MPPCSCTHCCTCQDPLLHFTTLLCTILSCPSAKNQVERCPARLGSLLLPSVCLLEHFCLCLYFVMVLSCHLFPLSFTNSPQVVPGGSAPPPISGCGVGSAPDSAQARGSRWPTSIKASIFLAPGIGSGWFKPVQSEWSQTLAVVVTHRHHFPSGFVVQEHVALVLRFLSHPADKENLPEDANKRCEEEELRQAWKHQWAPKQTKLMPFPLQDAPLFVSLKQTKTTSLPSGPLSD